MQITLLNNNQDGLNWKIDVISCSYKMKFSFQLSVIFSCWKACSSIKMNCMHAHICQPGSRQVRNMDSPAIYYEGKWQCTENIFINGVIYYKEQIQEVHGPWLDDPRASVTAILYIPCNVFPVLSQQLIKMVYDLQPLPLSGLVQQRTNW